MEKYPLKKYLWKYGDSKVNNSYYRVQYVPPSVAEKYLGKQKGMLNPDERQNESPTMKNMVKLAKKYKGTLEGYVIPVQSKRDDARITFDGIWLNDGKVDEKELKAFFLEEGKAIAPPDELDRKGKKWRAWWD